MKQTKQNQNTIVITDNTYCISSFYHDALDFEGSRGSSYNISFHFCHVAWSSKRQWVFLRLAFKFNYFKNKLQ